MRRRPIHPCPPDCKKRKVGCRSTCPEWVEYEADHFAWLEEKNAERIRAEDVALYQREAFSKGVRQKRTKH